MDTKALRQKVLDLAIRGKLVPQDPNDEPASVLLERIRQQKQQMVKDGKLKAKDIKNDTIIFVGEDNLHYEKFANGSVKCIEDEIPFELPDGWAWARIFSIAEDLPYGTAKKSSASGRIAVLRMGNIQAGEIDYGDLVFSSDNDDIEKYTLEKGDLLFNRTNSSEWVGKTAIYRGNIPAIYAGYLIRLRAFINTEYLNAVMNSDYAKAYCNSVKTDGVNQSNINAQKLGAFLTPIPPFTEQVRIASKIIEILPAISVIQAEKGHIENLVTQTKAKILNLAIRGQLVPQDPADEPASVLLERIRAEKEELIQQGKIKRDKKESVIFRGEDNSYYAMIDGVSVDIAEYLGFELPDGWSWITLKDIATITSGKTPKPDQLSTNGSVPYFKVADMSTPGNGLYLQYADCYINALYSGPLFDGGSFVFPKNGGAVLTNKKRILANASVVDLNTGVFTPSKLLNQDFIFFLFSSIDFSKIHKGAVIPTVDSSVIGNLIYGLPPIEEQKRIANTIKSLFAQVEQIEKALS
ncbi:restriction endonuclease subunit S [Oscillibacter valericigenes]|uniref:restriction endonuclease subunit S n=1 Tax=Oscillibacter valericigenes TaxID=351091 RepID=UPI001F3B887F|nr:restriction endonuclease subunit S [Oscillibacter valericigenes]MCF2617836.1 restriction endonuclease subunit S [Oscillibacter valericigenes]